MVYQYSGLQPPIQKALCKVWNYTLYLKDLIVKSFHRRQYRKLITFIEVALDVFRIVKIVLNLRLFPTPYFL